MTLICYRPSEDIWILEEVWFHLPFHQVYIPMEIFPDPSLLLYLFPNFRFEARIRKILQTSAVASRAGKRSLALHVFDWRDTCLCEVRFQRASGRAPSTVKYPKEFSSIVCWKTERIHFLDVNLLRFYDSGDVAGRGILCKNAVDVDLLSL